jgi:hypothetical protein
MDRLIECAVEELAFDLCFVCIHIWNKEEFEQDDMDRLEKQYDMVHQELAIRRPRFYHDIRDILFWISKQNQRPFTWSKSFTNLLYHNLIRKVFMAPTLFQVDIEDWRETVHETAEAIWVTMHQCLLAADPTSRDPSAKRPSAPPSIASASTISRLTEDTLREHEEQYRRTPRVSVPRLSIPPQEWTSRTRPSTRSEASTERTLRRKRSNLPSNRSRRSTTRSILSSVKHIDLND